MFFTAFTQTRISLCAFMNTNCMRIEGPHQISIELDFIWSITALYRNVIEMPGRGGGVIAFEDTLNCGHYLKIFVGYIIRINALYRTNELWQKLNKSQKLKVCNKVKLSHAAYKKNFFISIIKI